MLKTVEYLKNFPSVEDAIKNIKEEYSIKVNAHKDYSNIIQLKYDQLNSPMSSPISRECRGLILNTNDWSIVAYPFDKFWGYNEYNSNPINWETATVWDKLDGSLMSVYYYDSKWQVASAGLPDASGRVKDKSKLFSELFWDTWNELGYEYPKNTNYTYIFELTGPSNQVIVPHKSSHIYLIGARDINTLKEVSIDDINEKYNKPKRFSITSVEEAEKLCNEMNPMEQEGFVITDNEFNRVKMKSPQYAAISHLGLTKDEIIEKGFDVSKYDEKTQNKWMLNIVLTNEHSEFLAYYPQYETLYNTIKKHYDKLKNELIELYEESKNIESQKEFGKHISKHPFSSILFRYRNGMISSIEEGLRKTKTKNILDKLGK